MITVRLPAMLGGDTLSITEPVHTLEQLVSALGRTRPEVSAKLHDTFFNLAVNDEMLLQDVNQHPIRDGAVVEIVPAISGGR
jgi:molybdopterin converting factor small subunit